MVDCTGLENRRTERYRGFESLPLRKKKEAKASFFALEGMRTPEWGFVIDEVACQSKNPSLSARNKRTESSLVLFYARLGACSQSG